MVLNGILFVDGSTAHEHLHALIHFTNGFTMLAYKKKLQRTSTRLHSKTTFKKIICLYHAVGVLIYITCADGQKPLKGMEMVLEVHLILITIEEYSKKIGYIPEENSVAWYAQKLQN
ncbi:unnamed protein product [Psylliodes chrysocephalus]|uniref:Uncharacterized protein n=1 Tax=Psylliodes chrysocephalus TaxID=3402493 RepID=A0A9P0CM11_9CUCU|nr:unnamed protein product [Psylliodes chrysocephala]